MTNSYWVEAHIEEVEAFSFLMSKMYIIRLYLCYKIDILQPAKDEKIYFEAVTKVAMSTGIQMTDCEFIRMAY